MIKRDPVLSLAKALSDENRLVLLREIAGQEEISCADLLARNSLSQPTVSHHVKILVEAGLVVVRREGQRAFFRLNREHLTECLEACAEIVRERQGKGSIVEER